jgi:putative redox protein
MTIGMYARRKQWPLESVTVRLRHSKVHAADCESCETQPTLLDRIDREVQLFGPLAEEQRSRLLDIANKCPVHRTLTSRIDVQTRLV